MSPTPTHFTIAQTSRPKLQTPPTMHASSPPHHKPTVTDSTSVASPTSCAQVSHLQHPAHKCRISNILRTSAASPTSCAQVPHLHHPAHKCRISYILRTSAASPTSCTHHCSKPTPQDDGPVIAECVTPQIQGAYCLVIHHKIEQGLSASGPHFAPSQLQRVQLHVWFIAIGMHARERAYKAVMMKMVFEYR
jgi:hypothetical protein